MKPIYHVSIKATSSSDGEYRDVLWLELDRGTLKAAYTDARRIVRDINNNNTGIAFIITTICGGYDDYGISFWPDLRGRSRETLTVYRSRHVIDLVTRGDDRGRLKRDAY